MANKFVVKKKDENYSLANPPKGWSIQKMVHNNTMLLCGVSENGKHIIRISEDGKIYVDSLPFNARVDNISLTPCEVTLTAEYL